jgi:cytochrome oxidase assembly protein ShyY1
MIETVWIAFGCGTIIGVILGGLSMGLWTLQRAEEKNDEIDRLRTTRHLLKEEIFRLEKNYKPRKPQPRKNRKKYRRPHKVKNLSGNR